MRSEGRKERIVEGRVVVEREKIIVESGIIEWETEYSRAWIGKLLVLDVVVVVVVRAVSMVGRWLGQWLGSCSGLRSGNIVVV